MVFDFWNAYRKQIETSLGTGGNLKFGTRVRIEKKRGCHTLASEVSNVEAGFDHWQNQKNPIKKVGLYRVLVNETPYILVH